jgi:hypothetical protein
VRLAMTLLLVFSMLLLYGDLKMHIKPEQAQH